MTGMDVLSFNAIATSMTRLVYQEKIENAWVRMIAAQGEKKAMDRITGEWRKAIGDKPKETSSPPEGTQGAAAFLKALGIGSKGGVY